ncbi:MAG: hypothetical protein IAF94_07055 [Pirellulaceae bacterium]|nr:hypothetical protein [Pirellulaceae bacterium]
MPRTIRLALFHPVAAVVLFGLCFAISCGTSNPATSPGAGKPTNTIDVAALDFDTPELKDRLQLFDRTARDLSAAEVDWKHHEYTLAGNFVTAVWAQGAGYDEECRPSREPQHQVGTRKVEVDTIVVEGKAKSAAITIERVDASPQQWSVFCHYREATEQGIAGAGWGVTLFKWDAQKQKSYVPFRPYERTTARLQLGPRYSYQVENTPVEVVSELPQEQDFLRYLESPASLRTAYLEASGKLLKKIEEIIATHQAEKRIFGENKGDGRPPPTSLKPLTVAEEAGEVAKARKHFAELDEIVKEEHLAIHAALRKAFPFENCWPELRPDTQENSSRRPASNDR